MYQIEINKISTFSARNHHDPKNEAFPQLGLWAVSSGEDSSSVVKHIHAQYA